MSRQGLATPPSAGAASPLNTSSGANGDQLRMAGKRSKGKISKRKNTEKKMSKMKTMQMSLDRNGENESVLKYQSPSPSPSIFHVHFHLSFFFDIFPFDIFPSYHFFYHRTCVGLTEQAFKMLNQENSAEWVCDKCFAEKTCTTS